MVLRIHGKDESVVRFRQGAPLENYSDVKNRCFSLDAVIIPVTRDLFFYELG